MFGRPYEFPMKVAGDQQVTIRYTMHPSGIGGDAGPRIEWAIPEWEPLDENQVKELDEKVSEACFEHWKEHGGDYHQPGVQGGEQP